MPRTAFLSPSNFKTSGVPTHRIPQSPFRKLKSSHPKAIEAEEYWPRYFKNILKN